MGSEDTKNIIAFTILIFLYILLPVLSVFLVLLTFLEIRYILRFILERNFINLDNIIIVFILIIALIVTLKRLILWLRP